ncbi:ESPR-type extended signal peptide-containing protein [Mitsuokella multacida]|uniref:ESPR domain-containing protein n=1 Tax=Mitsuokella multacida TaxID=52226 RepID=UPI003F80EBC2
MNRIYKVIYSKARQCYIVVSELAKSNHKSSQQGADRTNTPALARIIAVALAAGALTWGSVPEVSWAADTGQADTGQNATTIQGGIHYFSVNPEGGNRNKNYENDGAVGDDSLAVGAGAHADGRMGATALGNDAGLWRTGPGRRQWLEGYGAGCYRHRDWLPGRSHRY